jgi:hypothetical protein
VNGRKARARRKERREAAAERALLPREQSDVLREVRQDRDRELGKLAPAYDKKLKALLLEHQVERRKIWARYDERREAIIRGKRKRPAKAEPEPA